MSKGGRKTLGKILRTILFVVFAGVFLFSAYKIVATLMEERESKQIVNNLQERAVTVETQRGSAGDEKAEDLIPIKVDFSVLKKECPGIVAWIYCPDTEINYPIAQSSDNKFYLHRLINGESNAAGTLFLDYRNQPNFSDMNNVVYGHNMKNGTMFGSLSKYEKQEYYDEHPVMYLLTPDNNYKIELLSSFITSADSEIYNLPLDENGFEMLISGLKEKSSFRSDATANPTDKVVTLSTCSYEYDVARRIVIGVLKEIK